MAARRNGYGGRRRRWRRSVHKSAHASACPLTWSAAGASHRNLAWGQLTQHSCVASVPLICRAASSVRPQAGRPMAQRVGVYRGMPLWGRRHQGSSRQCVGKSDFSVVPPSAALRSASGCAQVAVRLPIPIRHSPEPSPGPKPRPSLLSPFSDQFESSR